MKAKIIVICGPTASGKTALALHIASLVNGELVSADSRQVYKGMDIGTGKDKVEGVNIWGYDVVNPDEEYSVSDYQKFARDRINEIWQRNHLPILVGGTGFYIKAIIDGIDTIDIPKNEELRTELLRKSVEQLQTILKKLDKEKFDSLNESDRKNPVRLIRSIEVAKFNKNNKSINQSVDKIEDALFIGLKLPSEILNAKIEQRVRKRLEQGFEEEVKNLLSQGISWENQSMKSLGYRQWRQYFEGNTTLEEAIVEWIRQEQLYAKRQMTWFKKDKRICWFDARDSQLLKKVENYVKAWHNRE